MDQTTTTQPATQSEASTTQAEQDLQYDAERQWNETKEHAETAGQEAGDAVRELKESGEEAVSEVRQSAEQAAASVKEAARETGQRVKSEGRELLERQRERVAEELSTVESAIRRAAERFEEEDDEALASYVSFCADRINRISGYCRERDVSDIARDAENLTRRHPEIVYGGLFLIGVGLSRLFKASKAKRRQDEWREGRNANVSGPEDRSVTARGDVVRAPNFATCGHRKMD